MNLRLATSGKLRLRGAGRVASVTVGAVAQPEPTVTITPYELSANRVFQRDGTSKTVALSGTYTGAPAAIEARIVDADTSAAVTAWATLDAAPAGGAFSGTVAVPQGCFYKPQYRAAGGASATVTSTNKFGVGIVGLLIGQSNMVNRRGTSFKSPLGDKRSFEYRAGVFARAGNINDAAPANTEVGDAGYGTATVQSNRADGFILLANLLAQAHNLPVCLIEKANGGSAIASWVTTLSGSNWTAAVAELNGAGGDMEFALWHQGESDANLVTKDTMKGHLAQLMAQCHQQTGRTAANFHFGVVALGTGSYGGASEGEFGNMRAAHVEFANSTAGAYLSTCAHDVMTTDGVHINGEGFSRIGRRDARSLLHRFGVGVSGSGPYVTGVTRSGLQVTLAVAHNGGTALVDGAGGNGAGLTGFQFADQNGPLAYAASTISGPGAIGLTLASLPVGALTVAYAMMNNPHNIDPNSSTTAVVLASVPYDNVALHRTTNGCPLQPFSTITVTGA